MICTALRPCVPRAAIFGALLLLTACGSGSTGARSNTGEIQEVVKLLKSGHPGEIVISSARSPLIDGPYRFKPGGYVFSFEQHHRGRLTVSLESTPTSSHAPYQALIKTTSRQGRAEVRIAGTLYVHVVSESGYLLRFRPKHP